MFPTIPEWAEANGFDRSRGRPPRWMVEGWRRDNPGAPEMPIERKLRAEAAARNAVEPQRMDGTSRAGWCPCGKKLSGGAKRAGHTTCGPCRVVAAAGAQTTGHGSAGKSPENVPEIPADRAPVEPQTRRSEPQSTEPAHDSVPEKSPEKSPESAQSTGQPDGQRSIDHALSPDAGTLASHLERKCQDCKAKLSRYNPEPVCSKCQQDRIKANARIVRGGGYPVYPRTMVEQVDEAPSRESGVVAPRARGEVVLSDGSIAEHTTGQVRRDDKGRVICSGCSQPMIHFACGCDEGELDDDGIPLDTRWQDGVFIPEGGLASTA
jgi:hypothetical protein